MRVNFSSAVVALVVVGAASNCSCDDPPPPVAVGHLDLDTVLGPGEVRCGPVEKPTELIGGPAAYGQVGHAFRCHNSVIRFLIQDSARPVGNSVEGGDLIDVDRVNADEVIDGDDTFREFVPALGANEVRVEKIEVINDGTNGEPGVVRVTGTPTTITLAPQAVFLSQDVVGTVFTDYTLAADTDVIAITTTLVNEGDTLQGGLGADFLAFGGATPPVNPEHGFGDVPIFGKISFLAGSRGKHSNIAYVCDHRDVTIPLVESGATVAICDDNLFIGAEGGYSRFLVVGDGSVESVAKRAWELLETPTGTVSGNVSGIAAGITGEGGDDVVVTALDTGLADEDAHAVNEARVGADGSYSLTLPPGDYTLIAHVPSLTGARVGRSAEVVVSVVTGADASADLALGASGHVVVDTRFDRVEPTGPKLAAKLTLVPLDDTQQPNREVLHDYSKHGSRYEVSADGSFSVDVPPGRYRLLVSKGFEWTRHDEDIDVAAGATVEVDAVIERAFDTTGFVAGEFHQHTLGSIDAVVPLPLKVLENAAEGIEVAVSTDHDNIVDFAPFVAELGLSTQMQAFVGEEVSYQAIGHFNAYPYAVDAADPFRDIGSRIWWLKTLPQMYADIRSAAGGDAVIQLNHPRANGTGALQAMNFDPSDGHRIPRDAPTLPTLPTDIYTAWSPAFDAIEVNTNLGDASVFTADGVALHALADENPGDVPVLADWFGLLGAGLSVAAMGNSDTHQVNEGVGYPRTYLFTGDDDPTTLTRESLMATIRAQKTAIAEGCLLTLTVAGAPRMGRGDLLTQTEGQQLRALLQAPPHVTVGRFEVYVNGVAQKLAADVDAIGVDPQGVLSLDLSGVANTGAERLNHGLALLPLDEDAVVVAVSKGGSGLDPTGGGAVTCVSPAAYVDGDGDGQFTPWLAATEDVTQPTE